MPAVERIAWALALCTAIGAAIGFYQAFERGRCPCPRVGEVVDIDQRPKPWERYRAMQERAAEPAAPHPPIRRDGS